MIVARHSRNTRRPTPQGYQHAEAVDWIGRPVYMIGEEKGDDLVEGGDLSEEASLAAAGALSSSAI